MKHTILYCEIISLLLIVTARSELFVGSSTQVNTLAIAHDEAIVVSAARQTGQSRSWIEGLITVGGVTRPLIWDNYNDKAVAIAGPAVLSFPNENGTNSRPVVICYKRVGGGLIRSAFVPTGGSATSSVVLDVPTNKTCRFFTPLAAGSSGLTLTSLTVKAGQEELQDIGLKGGEEFTGPVSLIPSYALNSPEGAVAVFSYYITEDFLLLPDAGLLRGPSGSFQIRVERSGDLTNWFPVVVQDAVSDLKAFFRLRLSK